MKSLFARSSSSSSSANTADHPSTTVSKPPIQKPPTWTGLLEAGLNDVKRRADNANNVFEFIGLLRNGNLRMDTITGLRNKHLRFDPPQLADAVSLWSKSTSDKFCLTASFDLLLQSGLSAEILNRRFDNKAIWQTCGTHQLEILWNKRSETDMDLCAGNVVFMAQIITNNCKNAAGIVTYTSDGRSLLFRILREANGDWIEECRLAAPEAIIATADCEVMEAVVRRAMFFGFFADVAAAKRIPYLAWTTPIDRFRCDDLIDLGCRLYQKYYAVLLPNEIADAVSILPVTVVGIVAGFCPPFLSLL